MPYWLFYHVPRLALLERKPSRRLLKADICICGLNVLRLVFVLRHVFSVICMRALKLILWHPVQILGPHDSAERDIPRDKIFRENYRVFSGRRHEPDGEVNEASVPSELRWRSSGFRISTAIQDGLPETKDLSQSLTSTHTLDSWIRKENKMPKGRNPKDDPIPYFKILLPSF